MNSENIPFLSTASFRVMKISEMQKELEMRALETFDVEKMKFYSSITGWLS